VFDTPPVQCILYRNPQGKFEIRSRGTVVDVTEKIQCQIRILPVNILCYRRDKFIVGFFRIEVTAGRGQVKFAVIVIGVIRRTAGTLAPAETVIGVQTEPGEFRIFALISKQLFSNFLA